MVSATRSFMTYREYGLTKSKTIERGSRGIGPLVVVVVAVKAVAGSS